MSNKTYNGWTNYETWNVKLWMDNDGSDSYWNERAEAIAKREDDKDEARRLLADEIETQHQEAKDEITLGGCFSDMLTNAMGRVDWQEIAEGYIDEAWTDKETEEA
jgi:hypothetical protein